MKYLLIIFILFGLFLANGTDAARFDWSAGVPTILAEDGAASNYYGWSSGQPTVMYQFVSTIPVVNEGPSDLVIKRQAVIKIQTIIRTEP